MKLFCSQRSMLLCVAILAIAVLFNSCRKDLLVQSPDNLKSSLSIAEAKSYFNSHIATKKGKNAKIVFSNETTLEEIISNKQPLWDQAYQKMITTGQAVKIPIDFGDAYAIIDSKKNEVVPLCSLNYLFMYKDSLEKVHAEWVVLQPDTTWLYGNRSTYSGRVLVRDWNGKPIRNIIYSPSRLSDAGLSFKNRVDGSNKKLLSGESEMDNSIGFCTRFATGRCPKTYPCSGSYCHLCLEICAKLYCNFFDCSPECDLEDNGGGSYEPYPSGAGGGRPSSPGKGDYPPNECDGDGLGALKERFMNEKTMAVRPPCVPKPFVLESIANNIVWTTEETQFLASHPDIETAINSYLSDRQNSQEAKDFAKWAVAFLMVNEDITFSEIEQMNGISNSAIILSNIIDVTNLTQYPAFKNMLENLPAFLNQHTEVLNSLSRYTGFSRTKIMQLMQPGKGPKVELVSNLADTNGNELLGHYDRANKVLQIKKELVVGLDKVQSPKRYRALGMLLVITTLHEFVHYGRDINKLSIRLEMNGISYEPGLLFELSISPPYNYNYISRNNAIEWANFYKFNIND